MQYTHRKKPYHATAVQWDGSNTSEIEALFPPPVEVLPYGGALMTRFAPGEIQCMRVGWWAVRGENGDVKCYSNEQFSVKYEPLDSD